MQPANGRSGRLIRQFERQLEFRIRPRAQSKYAYARERSIFISFKFSDFGSGESVQAILFAILIVIYAV